MPIDKTMWHKELFPGFHSSFDGLCERCGVMYQAEPDKRLEPELCGPCLAVVRDQEPEFQQNKKGGK